MKHSVSDSRDYKKSNGCIGGWTGHTCHNDPLIGRIVVISQKAKQCPDWRQRCSPRRRQRNQPIISWERQSNHWKPLDFALQTTSYLRIMILSLGSRVYVQSFSDYVMSQSNRQSSAFVTDNSFYTALSKPWLWCKTLPAGEVIRLPGLVLCWDYPTSWVTYPTFWSPLDSSFLLRVR